MTTQAQQHWIAKLLGYDFDMVYRTGATNRVANALSRRGGEELAGASDPNEGEVKAELMGLVRPYWWDFQEVIREVEEDAELQKIKKDITRDPNKHPAYTMENGRLHYKGRMVLVAKSEWIPKLLDEFHTTPTGGHSGVYRTYRRIAQSLFWIGMKKSVTEYVARCLVCQQHKYLAASP